MDADNNPKPIGDQREKDTVATMTIVGGAMNIEIKFGKSVRNFIRNFCILIFFCSLT